MPTNDAAIVSKRDVPPLLLPAILSSVLASRAWATTAEPFFIESVHDGGAVDRFGPVTKGRSP